MNTELELTTNCLRCGTPCRRGTPDPKARSIVQSATTMRSAAAAPKTRKRDMQTHPSEAKKAMDEAERQAAVRLHRFIKPFVRDASARWRQREDIRNALAGIRDNADEAWLCLEKAERSEHDLTQASTAIREMDDKLRALHGRPKIVCLCGSLRFADEFKKQEIEHLMRGEIALMPCCMFTDIQRAHGEDSDYKRLADERHKQLIDLADEVLVLNVGGYVGNSTRAEIEYAEAHGKPVRWLNDPSSATAATKQPD